MVVEKEIGFLQYFPVVVVFINNENVSGRTEACGSYAKLWRSEKKLRCQSSLRPGPCKTSEYFLFLESWTTSGLPTAIETSLFGTATTWPVIFEEKNRNLWFCFCVLRDDEGNDDVLIELRRSWKRAGMIWPVIFDRKKRNVHGNRSIFKDSGGMKRLKG